MELRPFQSRNNALALALFCVDFTVVIGCSLLAVALEPVWLKALAAVGAGLAVASLFVLGHDAVHGSLTSSRAVNALLGRLAFFPSLHNVSLWLLQHNRIHHQAPNVRGLNSWSPLSPEEFRALPPFSRATYRVYRSGFGMGIYYLRERWLKHKLFPRGDVDADLRPAAWLDFALLVAWLASWLAIVVAVDAATGNAGPIPAIIWGFVIPFAVWNHFMGQTALLQHTHPKVRWYRTEQEARAAGGQASRTVHVRSTRWYGLAGHDIMEHPAHHLNPMIPCYHLFAAQRRLNEVVGTGVVRDDLGPRSLVAVIRLCKLYDYDRHVWMDFAGRGRSAAEIREITPA